MEISNYRGFLFDGFNSLTNTDFLFNIPIPIFPLVMRESMENMAMSISKIGLITQPKIVFPNLYPDNLFDDLARIGKDFGFNSSIISSFLMEYEYKFIPFFEATNSIDVLSNLPSFGEEIGEKLKELKSEKDKLKILFKSYVTIKSIDHRKNIFNTYPKSLDILQEINSFKYFRTQLN